MLNIEDLIKQVESSKKIHERAKHLFEIREMTLYTNGTEVPREECVAQEARFISQEDTLIAELRALQSRLTTDEPSNQ